MTDNNVKNSEIKWPEIWSLAALNAAIVICWIAYHEYQPKLLAGFGLTDLAVLLVYAKAIILVVIPPIAGIISDKMILAKNRIYFVFLVGIVATSMIFMIVASIIFQGSEGVLTPILPVMVILWLIGMNIFHTPANSLVQMFASSKQLPIAMGVLILVTELLYALEPVVVALVDFFGATLTFVVGGVLISATGFIFQKVSSDEVTIRKKQQFKDETLKSTKSNFLKVLGIGLFLGLGHALIMGYIPDRFNEIVSVDLQGNYFASIILATAAILALPISKISVKWTLIKSIQISLSIFILSLILVLFVPNAIVFIIGGLILGVFYSLISVTALPYVLQHLSIRHVTFGVGIFFGISELFDGIVDILQGI